MAFGVKKSSGKYSSGMYSSGKYELYISSIINSENGCSSNVGSSYTLPVGCSSTTVLAGAENFTVEELEVYHIQYWMKKIDKFSDLWENIRIYLKEVLVAFNLCFKIS